MSSDYRVVGRRLLNNVVSHYEIPSRDDITLRLDFLNGIRTTVLAFIRERSQSKIRISLICEMMRTDPATGNITNVDMAPFNSYQESSGVRLRFDRPGSYVRKDDREDPGVIFELPKNGSGWTLKKVVRLDITVSKNKPVKGSLHIPLPNELRRKNTLINMKNEDNQCFKWAVTRALYPADKNSERVSKELRKQAEELNWGGIEFPTPCLGKIYKKFEENNDVSLLVFGHKDSKTGISIIPLYVPIERRENVVRLIFLKDYDRNSHYCVIRSMSRLISKQVSKNTKEKYVCD